MGHKINWQIQGTYNDGSELGSKPREALFALLEPHMKNWTFFIGEDAEAGYICEFSTNKWCPIQEALTIFAEKYPDVRLFVTYRYDNAWNPDGLITKDGELLEITGKIVYTLDATGEEVSF